MPGPPAPAQGAAGLGPAGTTSDFLREHGDDPSVRAEAAASLFRVAHITGLIARSDDAVPLYRQAIALYEGLVRSHPDRPSYRNELAYGHSSLGLLLDGLERDDEAMAEIGKALALRDRLALDYPANPQFRADLARSYRHIGDLHRQVGDFPSAEENWNKARAIQEAILRNPPPKDDVRHRLTRRGDVQTVAREDLADILLDLSGIYREVGRWDEALDTGRRGREILEGLLRDRPADPELLAQLAGAYTTLSLTTLNHNYPDEAFELASRAIAILDGVVAANPSVSNYRGRLADACLTAGYALERLDRAGEATSRYRRTSELAEALLAAEPTSVYARSLVAQGRLYESRMLIRDGRLAEGLPLLRRAQGSRKAIVRDNPRVLFYKFNLAFVCRALGRAEEQSGRPDEALAAFDRARQLDESEADKIFIARYNQACDIALMARVARHERRESLATQAMELLRRSLAQGYRGYGELRADADLSILRNRPDFQRFLGDLGFPSDPFARAQ